ncbi:MAG: GAF domain-containing protein [Myxococcota bacterium]|nr:GAF domain-containing protein [Myxococcota bacterium]
MINLLDQLTKLAQAGKKLSNVQNTADLYGATFELIQEIFGHKTAAIFIKSKESNTLSIAAARGYDPEIVKRFRVSPGQGVTGYALSTGEPQLVAETISDPRYIPGLGDAISEMSVPLRAGEEVIGVLDIESRDIRFTSADLVLLSTFGEQIGTALRNLQLKTHLEERARRLVAVAHAGQSLIHSGSLSSVLERLIEATHSALELDTCAILLWDEQEDNLVVAAARGYQKNVHGLRFPRGTGISGRAALEANPKVVGDVSSSPDYVPGLPGCRSEMAVPLVFQGKVIGVLNAEHLQNDRFGDTDVVHAAIFADLAASAIGNARIRDALENSRIEVSGLRARLNLLSATAGKLGGITDFDLLLEEILRLAVENLKFQSLAVLLPDPSGLHLRVRKAHGYVEGTQGRLIPVEGSLVGEVYSTGNSKLVSDVRLEPRYLPGTQNARSEIIAPLRVEDDIVGVLDAESGDGRPLRETDLQILEMLASQVAIAVRNARQKEELASRNHRLTMIHRSVCSLNLQDDPDEMLGAILEMAQKAIGLESVSILLPDARGQHLYVRKARDHSNAEGLRVRIGEGFVGKMFVTGKAGIIGDVTQLPEYIPGTEGARCEMASPIGVGKEIIGILDAESKQPYAYSPADLDLLRIFASQVASALKKAGMVRALKLQRERLALLNRSALTLSCLLETEEVVREILRLATCALSLERCALLLVDPETRHLKVHAAIGYGDILDLRLELGQGVTGTVASSGEAVLVRDTSIDSRYVNAKAGGRCEMAAPLKVHGEVIGVLDTESPVPEAFDETDLELFAAFAAQAAVAVHNAQLFRRLEEANSTLKSNVEEMARLNADLERYAEEIALANEHLEVQYYNLKAVHEAGKSITSSLDLDTTLNTILEMTSKIVGSASGAIKLIDQESKELKVRAMAGSTAEVSSSFSVFDFPLVIGDKTIGVFEFVKRASTGIGESERQMLETMASQAAIAIENARLFESTQRIYYETLRSLAHALEARDDYTRGHSERVAVLAQRIGQKLGFGERDIHTLFNAALLHDIGKIGIRDEVLLAPRRLSQEEMETIRKHPAFGNAILMPLKFLGDIRDWVRFHHERWDGTGYPDGRRGDAIPLASRIIAVADTYDAMTSTRPYREALSGQTAITEIRKKSGLQFDPKVVDAFLTVIAEYTITD